MLLRDLCFDVAAFFALQSILAQQFFVRSFDDISADNFVTANMTPNKFLNYCPQLTSPHLSGVYN